MNENGKSRSGAAEATLCQRLGRRIAQARKKKGCSQATLARRLQVSLERLKKWERGLYCPPLEDTVKLCGALGVTPEELILGKAPAGRKIQEEERSEAASCLNAFLQAIRPWLQAPAGNAGVGPAILPAQRNDATICLSALLRVIRPWLEPPRTQRAKKAE
jgi:transcriptional regulator with XRE-family HTH domain